ECDYPPGVQHLPRVTSTPIDPDAPGPVIDAAIRALREAGRPVIVLDAAQLEHLAPDLILTQGLCEVCAVSDGEVHRLADTLAGAPRVLALSAGNLEGIWADIRALGSALDLPDEAEELVTGLTSRLGRIVPSERGRFSPAVGIPRVLCVEWLDPLYLAGHWVPELVLAAGAEDVGAEPGADSARRSWAEAERLKPDLVVVMLCGFGLARAEVELAALADPAALSLLGSVPTWVIDGNAYTSRAGPRVVDGAERLRSAIQAQPMDGLIRWR
ncbi:MAG: cobalamin-binding protein, partial [Gemmatimonadales bacterium]